MQVTGPITIINDRETRFSEECQGIAFANGHWFITQTGKLWKVAGPTFPTDFPESTPSVELDGRLRALGYDHFGDLDCHDGIIYVPIEGSASGSRPKPHPLIGMIDAESLKAIGYAFLHGSPSQAAWCAIHPVSKRLFISPSTSSILTEHDITTKGVVRPVDEFNSHALTDEQGRPAKLDGISGGAFTGDGQFLFLMCRNGSHSGLNIFETVGFSRKARITFKLDLSSTDNEPEGIALQDRFGPLGGPLRSSRAFVTILNNDFLPRDRDNVSIFAFDVVYDAPSRVPPPVLNT